MGEPVSVCLPVAATGNHSCVFRWLQDVCVHALRVSDLGKMFWSMSCLLLCPCLMFAWRVGWVTEENLRGPSFVLAFYPLLRFSRRFPWWGRGGPFGPLHLAVLILKVCDVVLVLYVAEVCFAVVLDGSFFGDCLFGLQTVVSRPWFEIAGWAEVKLRRMSETPTTTTSQKI